MPHIIYKCTNTVNGKVYIGQTITGLKRRKNQHLGDARRGSTLVFHRAIRKYGKENFNWEIIDTAANNMSELNIKEKMWVEQFNSFKKGYNSTSGGEGTPGIKISENRKKLISEFHLVPYEDIVDMLQKEKYTIITKKEEYKTQRHKIKILCPNGHEWLSTAHVFRGGYRCQICYKLSRRHSYADVVKDFKSKRFEVITTSGEYENCMSSHTFKFDVICSAGHKSKKFYNNFRRGAGCRKCTTITTNEKNSGDKVEIDGRIKIKMIEYRGCGDSFVSISEKTGISISTCRRRLKQWGLS